MGIQIFGQKQLESRIKNGFALNRNLISIGSATNLQKGETAKVPKVFSEVFDNVMRLEFDDIHELIPGTVAPSKSDIEKALKFYQEHGSDIAIHCWQGISRSTAIGLCLLCERPGMEEEAVKKLSILRPFAVPNPLIVRLYDEGWSTQLRLTLSQTPSNRVRALNQGIERRLATFKKRIWSQ